MKKLVLVAIAALFLSEVPAVPAQAQETPQEQYLCKVQAGNCLKRVDVVRRKMKKIEGEIKQGKRYSAEELQRIELKLKEVEEMLDNLKAK